MGNIKTTELDYRNISEDVYDINDNSINSNVASDKYRVLAVESNSINGMQAMAVAPVDSNRKIEIF